MPWDRIPAADFHPAGPVDPAVAALQTQLSQREASNADFSWLPKGINQFEHLREDKSLSLNLKVRQRERAQEDQERLSAENERRKADGLPALTTLEGVAPTDEPDVVLQQAAEIMADDVVTAQPTTTTAQAH